MTITPDEYKKLLTRSNSKYKAKKTIVQGIRFASQKEAHYFEKLKQQEAFGEIARFHRQVLFDLPGGIRHYIDFMIIHHPSMHRDDVIEYVEVKGYDTPISKLKRKQAENLYGVKIKIV